MPSQVYQHSFFTTSISTCNWRSFHIFSLLFPLQSLHIAPTQVTDLVITAFMFSLCITWKAPTDDGGQDISEYRIEIWDMSEYVTENFILVDTVGSNILTYNIEELGNDTDYR